MLRARRSRDFREAIARKTAWYLGVEIDPLRPGQYRAGDIRHCYADPSLARELLDLTDHIREIILDKRPISEVKRAAKEQGMRLLRESAVERVLSGLTTLREINKVTFVE